MQKEKKRLSKAPPEAGQPCDACGSGIKPGSIYCRLRRAKKKSERLEGDLIKAGQTKENHEVTINKLK